MINITYWSLGIDIGVKWVNGLATIDLTTSGDFVTVGEIVEGDLNSWSDEMVKPVEQQILFLLRGLCNNVKIDENFNLITEEGDFSDPSIGTVIPSLIGINLDDDTIRLIKVIAEQAIMSLPAVESAVIYEIVQEGENLQLGIEVKLISFSDIKQIEVIL